MRKIRYMLIFGLHTVRRILLKDIARVVELWVQQDHCNGKLQALVNQAKQHGLAVQIVPKKTLDNLTAAGHHQGIVVRCRVEPTKAQSTLEACLTLATSDPFLLVLDGVQDPHNLGACLRTAEAVGIQAVVVPKNRACSLSSTVHKAACGAANIVPLIEVTNLAATLRWLREQGIWLVGTEIGSPISLFASHLTGPLALILGSEGRGLRRLTRETCDTLVHIPMIGQLESLNVSVATAVCLYEALRQRLGESV